MKIFQILLIEDNVADIELIRETMYMSSKIPIKLYPIEESTQALAFLKNEEPFLYAPRPDLILLDLNLPRVDGREVLKQIKSDPELRQIPVVVFSSSETKEDIEQAYNLNANAYITKPIDLDGYETVIRTIESFWANTARLPKRKK